VCLTVIAFVDLQLKDVNDWESGENYYVQNQTTEFFGNDEN